MEGTSGSSLEWFGVAILAPVEFDTPPLNADNKAGHNAGAEEAGAGTGADNPVDSLLLVIRGEKGRTADVPNPFGSAEVHLYNGDTRRASARW